MPLAEQLRLIGAADAHPPSSHLPTASYVVQGVRHVREAGPSHSKLRLTPAIQQLPPQLALGQVQGTFTSGQNAGALQQLQHNQQDKLRHPANLAWHQQQGTDDIGSLLPSAVKPDDLQASKEGMSVTAGPIPAWVLLAALFCYSRVSSTFAPGFPQSCLDVRPAGCHTTALGGGRQVASGGISSAATRGAPPQYELLNNVMIDGGASFAKDCFCACLCACSSQQELRRWT